MEYDLNAVREAVLKQQVSYRGRKVYKDIANLGYTLDDVTACLSYLTAKDYRKTERYSDAVFDVYIKKTANKNDQSFDRIFIKLRLIDAENIEIVEIGSFHL
ncbi:type II toxin-antitoxin system MqsR family toxin [Methylocucumis oryzae]|uniref:Uncharacterized protein n=1 Tax=Methylocucumis oryzae TaxID=1632867 RepID=A0A0F3IJ44_9GAMM|nr:type II toxin-antitoxin system MqsR family toxin [Methylocucumis oryzae]KJV05554.1 hypothetical protein VZ94_17340 [Methylocucumis oryzae]